MTGAIKPDTLTSYRVLTDEELKRSSLLATWLVRKVPQPSHGGSGCIQAVPIEPRLLAAVSRADVASGSGHG
jgi:hypothetical protein